MASSKSILHGASLRAPAIEVINLESDEESTDGAVGVHFDRDADASNAVRKLGSEEDHEDDEDDDDWSLYEDVLDVIESDEIVSGGKVFVRLLYFFVPLPEAVSNVSYR